MVFGYLTTIADRFKRSAWVLPIPFLLTGCQHPRAQLATFSVPATNSVQFSQVTLTNRIDPTWLQPPTDAFMLGPGDKLELEILGDPTSKTTTVVGPDGKIYFNLLPGIDVWGLTLDQARAKIQSGLANT